MARIRSSILGIALAVGFVLSGLDTVLAEQQNLVPLSELRYDFGSWHYVDYGMPAESSGPKMPDKTKWGLDTMLETPGPKAQKFETALWLTKGHVVPSYCLTWSTRTD